MKIISHRGYWNDKFSKNSKESFEHSFIKGYGTETDLRDHDGEIVISHDMPDRNTELVTFESFLQIYKSNYNFYSQLPLALNVKADGLQEKAMNLIIKYEVENYFFFDMSIPDHIMYEKINAKTYSRQSEYESSPTMYEISKGIWLDAFLGLWYDAKVIQDHLLQSKKVALVSFELHKRDNIEQWMFLKENNFHLNPNIILCTDFPEKAKIFFYEK